MTNVIEQLRHGLIVSCQALPGEPLHGTHHMVAMAKAAELSGAVAIRANSPMDVRAIKNACNLPVIGLDKQNYPNSDVYITPTIKEIRGLIDAGADIIATDATDRPRPDEMSVKDFFKAIRELTDIPIMADVSEISEGIIAQAYGADIVSTTMAGYIPNGPQLERPDYSLMKSLCSKLTVPVIAEGRIWTPEEAVCCLGIGVYAVVVGSAITRPQLITERFVMAMKSRLLTNATENSVSNT